MALSYGTVTYRGQVSSPDGSDAGSDPDLIPLTGTVSFSRPPGQTFVTDNGSTIFLDPVSYGLDETGRLRDGQGNVGVKLIAGRWEVSFDLKHSVTNKQIAVPRFEFLLQPGATLDLGSVWP